MPSFFQSLSSLFSGSTNTRESLPISTAPSARNRRTTVRSPTNGVFSLPTHSPIFGEQDSPSSLNVASSSSATFSYPPTHTSYDYDYPMNSASTPGQNGLSPALSSGTGAAGRQDSTSPILPLHHTSNSISAHSPLSPLQSYPPLDHTWNRLRNWLATEYNELGDTLNYGIAPAVISSVQMELALPLPSAVRDSYLICDGQEVESSAGCSDGLFFGLSLLPLEDVLEEWRFWREVDEDPATGANPRLRSVMKSIPDGYVRREYSCRGWLPLITDRAGNYLGVDLHPGDGGTYGQVIVFGRDFDTKVVLWRGEGEGGWGRWLAGFVDELENGEGYEMNATGGEGSSDSEDDVGYESYFYSPNGAGQNDGEGRAGGLRLTGEYKGWNVLEAWADRSVKRWIQAGLYKEEPIGTQVPKPDIEITDAAAVTAVTTNTASSAEVPIPMLGSTQAQSLAVTTENLPQSSDISDASTLITPSTPRPIITPETPSTPSVSATVPKPAPMPTAHDLLGDGSPVSTHPNSPRASDDDPQHQQLNSAPSKQLAGGKMRFASEVSEASVESTAALVGDASFTSSHIGEGSMTEATLLPVSTALEEDAASSAAPSPRRDDLELKTPTALHFPTSTFGDLSKKKAAPLPNGAADSDSTTNGILPPPPPPKHTRERVPTPSSPAAAPAVAAPEDGSNSRPGTPSSVTSATAKRLQSGAHKKSTKSISKLFGVEKDRDSSSIKGSDDETSSIKEKKEKRGSAFGSPFKSKMTSSKEKKKSAQDAAA